MPPGFVPTTLVPVAADVAYADLSDAQKLDLYVPEEGDGPFPLVINIHGGAFMMGDKAMSAAELDPLVAAGYAVASLNYRLSGEALFPAQIQDVKAAVRWLRANAETYNLDPDHFAAFGASAGGNLAAMLGTSGDVEDFDDPELGNADVSSRVQAVVDWFGPTDFLQMDAQFAADEVCPASAESHDVADSPESMLLGAGVQTVPDLAAAANPITYVTEDDPPFFIQHGTADCNVPVAQSQLLYDALVEVTGEDNNTFIMIEGAGHGGEEFSAEENFALVIAFLDETLK
jgi:acetyl esterase/lipase